jgi:hypothetical protein
MISAFVVKSCADLAGVRRDLALDLAEALTEPLGPGFEPLARIMDAHGVEALRDILRRLLRADAAGRLLVAALPPAFVPIGKMA